jgi:hypothetical protein
MTIHRTHNIGPSAEIDGKFYEHCQDCGAVADELLAKPCPGRDPSLQVIDDGDVIAIQWESPEHGKLGGSKFPQPLITVDYALDGRPFQLVLAGERARELRRALNRWITFTDRELREIWLSLATAPTSGSNRGHEMIAEITVEANRRGEERAQAILHD